MNAKALLATAFEIKVDNIPDDANVGQFDLWDSLAHMHLVAAVEEALGRSLETSEILEIIDVQGLQHLLDKS